MAQDLLRDADESFRQNKYQEAAVTFQYVIRKAPDFSENPLVRHNLGRCLHELGKNDEAEE